MKNLKLALIATIVACAIINLSYADGFNARSNKCLSIVFSKVVQDHGLVIDMQKQAKKWNDLADIKTGYPDQLMLELPEEEYADDILFNTEVLAQIALLDRLMLKDEDLSVDDIPFDTEKIFNEIRMKELTAQWQKENNVDDVPFNIPHLSLSQQMIMKVMPEYLDMFAIKAERLIDFFVVLIIRLFFPISNSLFIASLFLMSLIFRVLVQYIM